MPAGLLVVDSPPGGNGNGRVDPLETAGLCLGLRNAGQASAVGVTGRLRSGHPLLSVIDSVGWFGTIEPGETAVAGGFKVAASSRLIPGTTVVCTLELGAAEPLPESTWLFELTIGGTSAANVATLDTGMVLLSVSSNGGIGREEPGGRGQGFRVPKDFPSSLRFASFAAGNSAGWLVDHFYGQPGGAFTNRDWITIDTLEHAAPWPADERARGRMSDAGHPNPRGVVVEQNWYQNVDRGYKDLWALGVFDIANHGDSALHGVYVGVLADFAVFPYADSNRVFFDTLRRAVRVQYLNSPAPTAGIVLLDPTRCAALAAVDNAEWVRPDSCLTEAQKFRLLSGAAGAQDSLRAADWTAVLSAGPLELAPGASARVALAVVGSINTEGWLTACDTAQAWYDRYFGGTGLNAEPASGGTARLSVRPSVARDRIELHFAGTAPGRGAAVVICDAAGRVVRRLMLGREAVAAGSVTWDRLDTSGRRAGAGAYFVRLEAGADCRTAKLILR